MRGLGHRIRHLRESVGVSQERLSELLGVSRPAISQIESGRRKLSADELIALSGIFGLSLDALIDPRKEPKVIIEEDDEMAEADQDFRISVPTKKLDKFKEVLLYILTEVGGRPNVGETVIYKLLYFIDFDYYEKYEEQLIGATYMLNKFGPTPVEFAKIVGEMQESGDLDQARSKYFKYPQKKYVALREPDLSVLNGNEVETIKDVLRKYSKCNADEIKKIAYGDVPVLTAEAGKPIDYNAVFYRTEAYSVRSDSVTIQDSQDD